MFSVYCYEWNIDLWDLKIIAVCLKCSKVLEFELKVVPAAVQGVTFAF